MSRLKQIGPAFVLAAVVLGPGSITLSTIAGSLYGYRLLWVLIVAIVFMIVFTWMSALVGLATRHTLFQASRLKYGAGVTRTAGLLGYLAILSFQAGNNAAVGFSASALLGGDVRLWAGLFFLPALGLLFLPNLYQKLELLVKLVIGLMILGFAGTLFIVGVDWGEAGRGLIPVFPDAEAVFLALGMAATTFSIAAAAYQSHLMKEKNWGPQHLATEGLDTILGIAVLGLISITVLMTSAGVLHESAERAFTAQAMAMQLEPLVGPAAFFLFTVGFFFASFSSLVVNPLIGATLLADGFNQETSMERRPVKVWAALAMAVGLMVVLVFEGSPVELLRVAQALAVIAFPLLAWLIMMVAKDRNLMGDHAVGIPVIIIGALGYLTILGIALNYLTQVWSFVS